MIGEKIINEMKKIIPNKSSGNNIMSDLDVNEEKIYAEDIVSFVRNELQRRKRERINHGC